MRCQQKNTWAEMPPAGKPLQNIGGTLHRESNSWFLLP